MATPLSNILLQRMVVEIGAKSETSLDNSTPNDPFTLTHAIAFAFGSGASQYDLVWHDTRLLAAGASEELDVAGGLTDAFGNTLTFDNLKVIFVANASDEAITDPSHTATIADLLIGGSATPVPVFDNAGDILPLGAGDVFLTTAKAAAGIDVTAATGDLLKIENNSGSLEAAYRIALFGDSA